MRADLRHDLTAAMKAKDRVAVTALRSALAAIDNAEAVPMDAATGGATEVAPRELTEADQRAILAAEVADRGSAAAQYEQHGKADAADRLRAEAAVLRRYLPRD